MFPVNQTTAQLTDNTLSLNLAHGLYDTFVSTLSINPFRMIYILTGQAWKPGTENLVVY